MKKKSSPLSTILLILVLILGLSLLLYPTVSDYWNSLTQSRAIASYSDTVAHLNQEDYSHIWEDAIDYNQSLNRRDNPYALTDEQQLQYKSMLSISGGGVMGYVEIPCIDVSLPIYHGTDESVLQEAVGHLEWTSLPTGGESTHCVISGHRGLPRAKLFTDLNRVQVGDVFILRVLDEILTYEVDQILIVEPDQANSLLVEEGKDLCTLVTCTPYGVNTHRLLVRGHRVENAKEAITVRVTADAIEMEPLLVAVILFPPVLIALLLLIFAGDSALKRRGHRNND